MKKNYKEEDVMKRILVLFAVVTLLLTLASTSEAWQVTVKNSCNKAVSIFVIGEHMFWEQIDCTLTDIPPGTTQTCTMPGLICPKGVQGVYSANGSPYELPRKNCGGGGACCWNVNYEVIQYGRDSCKFQ